MYTSNSRTDCANVTRRRAEEGEIWRDASERVMLLVLTAISSRKRLRRRGGVGTSDFWAAVQANISSTGPSEDLCPPWHSLAIVGKSSVSWANEAAMLSLSLSMYVCMYVCMYASVYLSIYIHTYICVKITITNSFLTVVWRIQFLLRGGVGWGGGGPKYKTPPPLPEKYLLTGNVVWGTCAISFFLNCFSLSLSISLDLSSSAFTEVPQRRWNRHWRRGCPNTWTWAIRCLVLWQRQFQQRILTWLHVKSKGPRRTWTFNNHLVEDGFSELHLLPPNQALGGLPNANAKSQRFSYAISQIAPLPPVVALNCSSLNCKSQSAARYAAFWHAIPKSHWPLSFSAPKLHSVLNRSVFKTQTQLNRKR